MEQLDLEETKQYKAAVKEMGEKNVQEFIKKSDEELKRVIADNTVSIQTSTSQTKENDEYVKASETLKAFRLALSEQTAPLKKVKALASLVLSRKKLAK